MKSLGKREWERVHGERPGPALSSFVDWGWKWEPLAFRCKGAHYLDQGDKTKVGKR